MSPIEVATGRLALSTSAIALGLTHMAKPDAALLGWAGAELERLAGEAYRLADEASQAPGDAADHPVWPEGSEVKS